MTVLNVRVGTPVSLDCESNAIPAPVITWYKNGRIIPDSAAVELLADGQTLRIEAAEVGQEWGRLHLLLLCHCQAITSVFRGVFYLLYMGDVFPGGFSSCEKHFELTEAQVFNVSKL